MNALRWIILLAVVAIAALLLYLATSDPTERVDRDISEPDAIHAGRIDDRDPDAERSSTTVYRAGLEVALPGGSPAPHASIEVRGAVVLDTEANESGVVSVEGLLPGHYNLLATSGRATGALDFEVKDGDVDLGTLRLVAGILIRGTVFGAKGEPIPGALIEAVDASASAGGMDMTVMLRRMILPDRVVSRTLAGDNGVYLLTVPRGEAVQLRATVSGHAQEGYPARSFGADVEGLDFHLMTGAPVAGRVTGPDGAPVVGAQILAVDPMSVFGSGLPKCETLSDAEGRFELTPGSSDQMMLLVHATGFAMYTSQGLKPPVLDLSIELEHGFSVKLRAVDKDDPSAPAPNVDVTVVYGGSLEIGRTNERGEMLLTHIAASEGGAFGGGKMAFLWGGGFVPHAVDLSDREPADGLLDLGVVALDRGGIVRGRVTDAVTGDPIEGAAVRTFGGLDRKFSSMGGQPATTDAEGRYELRGVPLKAVTVLATHGDYTFDPQALMQQFGAGQGGEPIFEPGKRETVRDLSLTPAQVLHGKVVAPDGRPVVGARIVAGDSQSMLLSVFLGGGPPVVFTDANGAFELIVPPALMGTPKISATHRDFGPSEPIPVPESSTDEIVLRLQAPHIVRGQVVDAEGKPLATVRVRAAPKAKDADATEFDGMLDPLTRRSTTTDPEGRFVLRNAPSGEVELHFEHPEYAPGKLDIFIDRKTDATDAPTFTLKRGESIAGLVVDSEGKVVPGAHVFASFAGSWGDSAEGRTWGNATTDPKGRFLLGGLRPGLFRVQVTVSGHYCRESDVSAGGEEVRLVLVKAVELKGRVISRGSPVVGAWVQASLRLDTLEGEQESWDHLDSKRTDSEGEFRLTELPPDRPLRITVRHDLYREAKFDDVVPDGQERTFHLQAGRQVTGIVVDQGNRPVARVRVWVTDGNQRRSVESAEDGTFAAGGLASERIGLQTQESNLNLIKGEETEVVAGSRNVRLVVTRGLSIDGRILGLDSSKSEWLGLSVLDSEGNTVQTGHVDSRVGTFEIRGIPPGTYTLQLNAFGPIERDEETYGKKEIGVFEGIAAGSTGLELTLPQ